VLVRLIVALLINAAALWVANQLFDGVSIHGWTAYIVGAAILGIANAILKPILTILTLPIVILTLGLFLLVINIVIVAVAEWLTPDFSITGFWAYVGTVIVVWVVNFVGHAAADRALRD
jgi:putative membrane protein